MFSRTDFANLLQFFKQLASLIKNASVKTISLNLRPKNNILSKITKAQTKTTNLCFVVIIITACLATIALSYYEQRYHFEQQLFNKTSLVHNRLAEKINNFKHSLDSIKTMMLKDAKYLDSKKLIQLLKFFHTKNKHLSLLALTWNPISEKHIFFSAFGEFPQKPDDTLLTRLQTNQKDLIITDFLDELNIRHLTLVLPVLDLNNQNNQDKNLLGFLKMQVEVPSLLQSLYDNLSDNDLLKVSQNNKIIYFGKQEGKFVEQSNPILIKYQFADNSKFFVAPYTVAIAQEKEQIIANTIQTAGLRCAIILSIGSFMLLAYNYIARRRAKDLCQSNEALVEEISSQETQIQYLINQLKTSDTTIETLAKQKNQYTASTNLTREINNQIKQELTDSLHKIRDISLLKQHNANKDVTPEVINKTLDSIHRISEDLICNLVNRNSSLIEIDIADLFTELFVLFEPIIYSRSIKLEQKIEHIDIIVNELALKQVLISLLFRVFSSCPENAKVKITANKAADQTAVVEISSDGYSLSEQMITSILGHSANDLPADLNNIQINHKFIEKVIQEILAGKIVITKKNHNNKITVSLPLKRDRYEGLDNVIDFYKIANEANNVKT